MKITSLVKIFRNPAAMALGALGVLGGIRVFFDPHSSPVAIEMPRVIAYSWGILYASGGLAILMGVILNRRKWEASGWTAFAGGTLIQALATFALLDTSAILTVYSIAALLIFTICGFIKAYILRAGYQLLWFKDSEGEADDRLQ